MSAFAEAMAAQKAQQRVEPPAPPVAIRGQARAAASAIRAAVVGNTPQGERMDVDGNSKNRRGAQTTRGPRTHNNNSTPYAKGRPTKNTIRDRESNPNHNRYGAIELIDKSSDGPRGLLSRIDGPSRDGPPGAGPSRSRPSRPNQDSRTNMKSINAEVKTMQRKAIPKYRPDLNTPEMTKWLAGRFKDGVLDMSGLMDDEFLKQQKIVPPGAPDAPPFAGTILWQAVNTIVQREHSTPISILSLANNGFTSLRQLQRLCWYLRDVRRIDLSGNPVTDVTELKHVNTKLISKKTGASSNRPGPYNDLVELKLAGVPFSEKLMAEKGDEGYMNAILGFFPNLNMLDGVDLTELKAKLAGAQIGEIQSADPSLPPSGAPQLPVAAPMPSIPAPITTPGPSAPIPDDAVTAQRNEWIAQFSQASGMNATWSTMCLEKNEWNPEAAWTNFTEIRATIPAEAFVQ